MTMLLLLLLRLIIFVESMMLTRLPFPLFSEVEVRLIELRSAHSVELSTVRRCVVPSFSEVTNVAKGHVLCCG